MTENGTVESTQVSATDGKAAPRSGSGGNITAGLLLIVIGLIFLGERLDVLPGLDIGKLWPLILIVLGVASWLKRREDGKGNGGWWLMLIGALFLLNNFRVLSLNKSWPLFIVAGGLSILFSRGRDRHRGKDVR